MISIQYSWLSFIVFVIAMCVYTYYLIIDYRSSDTGDRDSSEVTWIWINFSFLLIGILVSGYFIYSNTFNIMSTFPIEPIPDKKTDLLKEPFNKLPDFVGTKNPYK